MKTFLRYKLGVKLNLRGQTTQSSKKGFEATLLCRTMRDGIAVGKKTTVHSIKKTFDDTVGLWLGSCAKRIKQAVSIFDKLKELTLLLKIINNYYLLL